MKSFAPPQITIPHTIDSPGEDVTVGEEEELEMLVKKDRQKADNATVPIHLWDFTFHADRKGDAIITSPLPGDWQTGLSMFRKGMLLIWRRKQLRSWKRFADSCLDPRMRDLRLVKSLKILLVNERVKYEWTTRAKYDYRKWHTHRREANAVLKHCVEKARDCMFRAAESSWWEWSAGSTLFFWKWPRSHMVWARDGQPHFEIGKLPRFLKGQIPPKDGEGRSKMKAKLDKVRQRLYIEVGTVLSLTHMFYVLKGLDDIRMVYNGTSCGLNAAIWSPHFGLPLVRYTFRSLLPEYHQCDMDVQEMFMNFQLGLRIRQYAGVDVSHVRDTSATAPEWEKKRTLHWERWGRNFMGLTDSPYRSLQLLIKVKHIAYGNRHQKRNPFAWRTVILNLPGSATYNPRLPWVMKLRTDGHLACEVYIYVDDGRITGFSKMECWRAAKRFCSVCTDLGVQDAS